MVEVKFVDIDVGVCRCQVAVDVTDEQVDPEIQIWQVSCRDLARLVDDGGIQSRAVPNGP